ncbi:hypothetical protein FZEAL_6956 [Fusarium zealandicum]|uniref:Protein kinase domain-containing protein n=1 Tax=Fusarium zealandicum TaxID=1053134 RepID=A0A8H4XIB5_9HYPO|nr:hypothetical protein FZEAL_6956 [Fusarium zealandicum]
MVPKRGPLSTDDHHTFPLDGRDIILLSDEELLNAHSTAPRLHEYGHVKITRVSKSLVIKGGFAVAKSESENMIFASEFMHLPVPKVHHTFTANIPSAFQTDLVKAYFIVMDYIPGSTLEKYWPWLDGDARQLVTQQVAEMIERMQSRCLNDLPPGPLGRDPEEKFEGPWFTDYGAGPFTTLTDLEAWFNHKIDACTKVNQLPAGTPKFQFQDVVFTHQDIAPRNLIVDESMKVWLIDWGCAGVYPRGFDQAVLRKQSWNGEFADMVLTQLPDQQRDLTKQYSAIVYGMSTGRPL